MHNELVDNTAALGINHNKALRQKIVLGIIGLCETAATVNNYTDPKDRPGMILSGALAVGCLVGFLRTKTNIVTQDGHNVKPQESQYNSVS